MFRTRLRKTWADRQAIRTGIWNERHDGITICEENRATTWEFRKEGIRQLIDYCQKNYTLKGVKALVYGVDNSKEIRYAVFVRAGFLRSIPEDEDLTVMRRKKK